MQIVPIAIVVYNIVLTERKKFKACAQSQNLTKSRLRYSQRNQKFVFK